MGHMKSETFQLFADEQRRDVVGLLREREEIEIDQIGRSTSEQVKLIHCNLPKLEEHNVVQSDGQVVSRGPEFEHYAGLLGQIEECW